MNAEQPAPTPQPEGGPPPAPAPPAVTATATATWIGDILRALGIVAAAAILGIGLNAFSRRPVPLLAANGPGAPPEKSARITLDELKSALDQRRQVMLIDVRSPAAFAAGHPAGARNAPAAEFIARYRTLAKWIEVSDIVVLLCDSERCPKADRAARLLEDAGHTNVKVLLGGWEAYAASGMPVEKGAGE